MNINIANVDLGNNPKAVDDSLYHANERSFTKKCLMLRCVYDDFHSDIVSLWIKFMNSEKRELYDLLDRCIVDVIVRFFVVSVQANRPTIVLLHEIAKDPNIKTFILPYYLDDSNDVLMVDKSAILALISQVESLDILMGVNRTDINVERELPKSVVLRKRRLNLNICSTILKNPHATTTTTSGIASSAESSSTSENLRNDDNFTHLRFKRSANEYERFTTHCLKSSPIYIADEMSSDNDFEEIKSQIPEDALYYNRQGVGVRGFSLVSQSPNVRRLKTTSNYLDSNETITSIFSPANLAKYSHRRILLETLYNILQKSVDLYYHYKHRTSLPLVSANISFIHQSTAARSSSSTATEELLLIGQPVVLK